MQLLNATNDLFLIFKRGSTQFAGLTLCNSPTVRAGKYNLIAFIAPYTRVTTVHNNLKYDALKIDSLESFVANKINISAVYYCTHAFVG